MNKRVHVVVSGKVQGVFFRSKIRELASKLKITGYVRNVQNDKLEAIFEGDDISVNNILKFCKEGPEEAEVSAIVIDEETYKGEFKDFSVIN
ncbi:acylphosphatase [Candidatus Woesearchaeota archaeon]|nr:acylphosphatase [Candidatus Woesearchaeota archaeon]